MRGIGLALMFAACAAQAADELPYRTGTLRIDGDLGDWRGPNYRTEFAEPHAQGNRVAVRMTWDLDALYLALRVDDGELIEAPTELALEQFHQYDSIQIYIDPRGDEGAAMNRDDVDVIVLPDGRSGVLRGDELVAELTRAQVAQRQGAPLALDYAAQRDAQGWTLELRLPFAGLGITPATGHALRLDVAMNDWLVDHAPAVEPGFDAQSVRSEVVAPTDPDPAVGTQILPRTWSGQTDFGYPQHWRRMHLVGAPPALERWVRAYGLGAVLTVVAVAMLGLLGLGLVMQAWLFRRRLRALLARLPAASATVHDVGVGDAMRASDAMADTGADTTAVTSDNDDTDPRDRAFADEVLTFVRANLSAPLTPADLAARFHVSVRTLQRRLRTGVGSSPQDLVLAARLEAAHSMLRSGGKRVGEVAYAVGFEDLSHFAKRFRAAYGMPPSQFARGEP
jgi:AraC-like DNA-binding protein